MGDDVVVVVTREEGAVEDGLDLQGGAHAAELEVPQPKVAVGQTGILAGLVQEPAQLSNHGASRRVEPTTSAAHSRSGRSDLREKVHNRA